MDIGGIGFGPDATDVFMEGLYIPMLKLIDQGVVNETLMAMIRSQHAAADRHRGRHLFAGRLQRCRLPAPGRDDARVRESTTLDALGDFICDRSREAVLAEIAKLPKGTWRNSMIVDGYDEPVTLAATLTISETASMSISPARRRLEVRHQRAALLHHRLYRVRPRLRGRLADPEQCRLALAADRRRRPRARSSMRRSRRRWRRAMSSARCCPTWCSAACARSFRSGCRPKARPACGISTCAARPAAAPAAITASRMAVTSQRRHRRAFRQGRPVGHRLSQRRARHAGRDRRDADAVDLLAQGAAPGFGRRRPHARRARPDHRGRQRHRCAVRHSGRIRPHRPSAARPRRRP